MPIKSSAFPYRRGSEAYDRDFFDIEDESIAQIAKRQLRRPRTWITLLALFFILKWWYRARAPASPVSHIDYSRVDWSRYAYTQYATSETYLCSSVMIFEALDRLGSQAERVLFYPQQWDLVVDDNGDRISQLLLMAMNEYKVNLRPVFVEGFKAEEPDYGSSQVSWDTSAVKLSAFGLLEYDRVIHLDSDMTLLSSIDELFFLPKSPVAMPRAHWLLPETTSLSSFMIVIEPSYREYTLLQEGLHSPALGLNLTDSRMDMELLNSRYGDSAMVLPHREYGLLSEEFRKKDHWKYLGNAQDTWNPDKVLAEAKLVYFSDWPLPKPWIMWPQKLLAELQPACEIDPGTPQESGCRNREVWKRLYDDFRRRRKDVCKLLSFPAPV